MPVRSPQLAAEPESTLPKKPVELEGRPGRRPIPKKPVDVYNAVIDPSTKADTADPQQQDSGHTGSSHSHPEQQSPQIEGLQQQMLHAADAGANMQPPAPHGDQSSLPVERSAIDMQPPPMYSAEEHPMLVGNEEEAMPGAALWLSSTQSAERYKPLPPCCSISALHAR